MILRVKVRPNMKRFLLPLLVLGLSCGTEMNAPPPVGNSAPVCGNGVIEGNEACDDGNTQSGDYCSTTCSKVIGSCGDGRIQFSAEACDTGGSCQAQFCSADCQSFTGVCGDGIKQTPEGCDDGNTADDDGCSSYCTLEAGGWRCSGSACGPTMCTM